jgi:hypothetical protein
LGSNENAHVNVAGSLDLFWELVCSTVTAICGSSTGEVRAAALYYARSSLTFIPVTRPFFARERVTDFGIFDSRARVAIQKMEERFDRGDAIDFQARMDPVSSIHVLTREL